MIIKPAIKDEYQLKKTDKKYGEKGSKTMISVRQSLTGEQNIISDMFADFTRRYDDDGTMTIHQRLAFGEISRKQVYLTLASCDLQNPDGTPFFEFENERLTSEVKFNEQWAKLPLDISEEIIECVHKTNFWWGKEGK